VNLDDSESLPGLSGREQELIDLHGGAKTQEIRSCSKTDDAGSSLMARTKRRILWKEGGFVAIDLGDGYVSFGRLLKRPVIAFYDVRTADSLAPEEIIKHPVLFKLCVMRHAITRGTWPVIATLPLDKSLREQVVFFRQDPVTTKLYRYLDIKPNGRNIPATPDQVEGLERAAAWNPEHVVERLNDHFSGRPYRHAELLHPKPVLSEEEQQKIRRALDAKYKNLTAKKRTRPAKQKTARPTPKRRKQ
jgi:hypothetical protein